MVVFTVLGVIVCTVKIVLASGGGTDCNDGRYYIREDPASCTTFYKCDHGNPVLFNCPPTLYFNPAIHNCDWPYNVKCGVNQGQGSGPQSGNNGNGQNNGYPNNNGGQYNGNNGYPNNNGGQYNGNNGYPNNNGGQYNGNNGYPNNNGGQYNGNNGYPNSNGGQYNGNNGYPNNNGGHYNGNNDHTNNNGQHSGNQGGSYNNGGGQGFNKQNQYDDNNYFYPVQTVDAQDPEIAPSINEPDGIFGERPRPTIDDLYSNGNHPYQEYLDPNPKIDIRK